MAYAILRVQKLKTMGDIGGSLSHNYRNRLTLMLILIVHI